eukprot:Skav205663  [mRNA]  locus=scaffold458:360719:361408:+ [translate_table: standard]
MLPTPFLQVGLAEEPRYTMCFGGIFDIFLYHLSQEQQVIFDDPIAVGGGTLPPIFEVNTYSNFELIFELKP